MVICVETKHVLLSVLERRSRIIFLQTKRKSEATWKEHDSILVNKGRWAWLVNNATPAPSPLYDLMRARSLGLMCGNRHDALKTCSTLLNASCCQPAREDPGSWSSGFRCSGKNRLPDRTTEALQNLPSSNCVAARLAASMLGDHDSPSNCCTIKAATVGCLACIMGTHRHKWPHLRSDNFDLIIGACYFGDGVQQILLLRLKLLQQQK